MNAPLINNMQTVEVADAAWHLKRARNALLTAMFRLDDGGYGCFELTLQRLAAGLP